MKVMMLVVMLGVAAIAGAGEGFLSFFFNEEDCVNVVVSTPAWRLSAAKRQAMEEFRKPTAVELNVGTYFEVVVWNGETLACRDLRPKELVITDAADNVRARYLLAPSTAVKANAFGASGAFYTATVPLQRAAVARAFGENGRLHIITSNGRRTTTFEADTFADAVDYETDAQRKARQGRRDEERKAEQERRDKDTFIKIAGRLDIACEPSVPGSDAYIQLASAVFEIRTANLTRETVTGLLRAYADCLAAKKGTLAEAEAGTLLKMLE